ncbi:hypothetical protein GCM10027451_15420 [Geodermatophilus aquaeductus]|uniref:Uncharacterized protein n=1 Tax=Geodermatophilus aquaeductus TaxID=1564161 RepID=A0A521BMI1_9ACTN|nr:hypothetical protein [Geodermatophilus aquaeductus]SMO47971.1 hypothetical protein SAMN06273567_101840 [Geodermatophilus aquaeductus]
MTDLDTDVRDALHRLAAGAGLPRGEETAAAAVALSRRQRRTRVAWAAGAVAVALLGAAVPAVLPDAGPVAGQVATEPTAQARVYDAPTRGSLADDADFVAGVAAVEWSAPLGVMGAELHPPASTRRVLFAGDLPGGRRWALVMGEAEGQLVSAWFGGPAGAAAGELRMLAPPERGGGDQPVALLETAAAGTLLVVVGRPGDTARYSSGTLRFDDGAVGRVWTDLPGADGVLAAEVDPPVYDGAELVDVAGDGAPQVTLRDVPRTDGSASRPALPLAWVRVSATTDPVLRDALTGCLLPYGFTVGTAADGDLQYGYPPVGGTRSDDELARLHAAYDAVLTVCLSSVTDGG